MRKLMLVIYLLNVNYIISQNDSTKFRLYGESAIVSQQSYKYSIFEVSEYRINQKFSIVGHPLMIFLSPSISLKYNFYNKNNLSISSVNGFNYPTILMNIVKAKGTGGFISPEFEIPNLFSIRNSIIATLLFEGNVFLTGSVGFEFALNNSKLEPGTSIDLPIILPRSLVYYKNVGFILMIETEGVLIKDFDFGCKSEIFFFPIKDDKFDYEYQETSNNIFWELSGNVFWNIRKSFKLGVGGRLCYGTYPFGDQWHLLPFIDFVKYIE
jgi:hypothetical protein